MKYSVEIFLFTAVSFAHQILALQPTNPMRQSGIYPERLTLNAVETENYDALIMERLDFRRDTVRQGVGNNIESSPALVLNADYSPLSHLPLSLWCWQDSIRAVFSGKAVVVSEYSDLSIRGVSFSCKVPSVIALTQYQRTVTKVPIMSRRNVYIRDGFRCQYCGDQFPLHELSLDHVVPRSRGGTEPSYPLSAVCCLLLSAVCCPFSFGGRQRPSDKRHDLSLLPSSPLTNHPSTHTHHTPIPHLYPFTTGKLTWTNTVSSCLCCNYRKGQTVPEDLHKIGMKLRSLPRAPSSSELQFKAKTFKKNVLHPHWQVYISP